MAEYCPDRTESRMNSFSFGRHAARLATVKFALPVLLVTLLGVGTAPARSPVFAHRIADAAAWRELRATSFRKRAVSTRSSFRRDVRSGTSSFHRLDRSPADPFLMSHVTTFARTGSLTS
jgi:hypothetical protein